MKRVVTNIIISGAIILISSICADSNTGLIDFEKRKCFIDLLELLLKKPNFKITKHTVEHAQSLFEYLIDTSWNLSLAGFKLLKVLLEIRPDLVNVNYYVIEDVYQGQPWKFTKSYIEELFFLPIGDDDFIFNPLRQKVMKLVLKHPSFDAKSKIISPSFNTLADEGLDVRPYEWSSFFEKVIHRQEIGLMPTIYQAFKDQQWFQDLPYFVVFEVVTRMFHGAITPQTAKEFLLIDQKNPPKSFESKNVERLQKAYVYAKEGDLRKIGNLIRTYMIAAAKLSYSKKLIGKLPQELISIISSYYIEPETEKTIPGWLFKENL